MKKNLLFLEMFLFEALKRNRASCRQLTLVYLVLMGFSVFAQELVRDINQMEDQVNNEYKSVIDVNGTLYFISETELWKSSGTTAGTAYIKTFLEIRDLVNVSGKLFFVADDGSPGAELWMSDGTAAGTVMLKDILPGVESSDPQQLTAVGNMLYFVANDGTTGRELWKSDGRIDVGTVRVKDILKISGSSNPAELTAVSGLLYFVANNGENGYELWRSDGTTNGTNIVRDIYGGTRNSSRPEHLTNVNGVLFFSAFLPATGRELWKSDGTNTGTERVKDIVSGTQGATIGNLVNVSGTLFFSANDRIHGEELWKSDGTAAGTAMVKDLTPGARGSGYRGAFTADIMNFTEANGKLYFTAHLGDEYYFWKSDGTEAGTLAFMPATSLGIVLLQPDFTSYRNDVYFYNGGGDYPVHLELWREASSDGSLKKIKTFFLNDYYDSSNQPLAKSGNFLYLTAREGDAGFALFKSDGTTAGTGVLIDTVKQTDQSSSPDRFLKIGDLVYFTTRFNEMVGVWATDGTTEGTHEIVKMENVGQMVNVNGRLHFAGQALHQNYWTLYAWDADTRTLSKLLLPEYIHQPTPHQLTVAGNKLFFLYNRNDQADLWVTDDSTATMLDTDFSSIGLFSGGPGDYLYFSAAEPAHGMELWKTNGTTAGTILVNDINPGPAGSFPRQPVVMNNIIYFQAQDSRGFELWRSDGTSPGTYMVKDTNTGTGDTDPSTAWEDMRGMMAVNGSLYFTSMDASSAWWLWKTDGTSAGTIKVKLIPAPVEMLNGQDKLFFVVWDGAFNMWKSDGTGTGTFELKTIVDDGGLSTQYDYLTINNILYFTFETETLWRSDGTVCGTYELHELSGYPHPIEKIGSTGILFAMDNAEVGRELFKFDVADQIPCSEKKSMASTARSGSDPENIQGASAEAISQYPNPFKSNFSLLVNGQDGETYRAKILTTNNMLVEDLNRLMYNQPYDMGSSWHPGLYLLIILERDKMTVRKIVKN